MAKYNIEGLRKEFAELGWTLVSDKYTNLSTQLEMVCPKGHTNFMSYDKFRKNHICPECMREELNTKDTIERKPKKKGTQRVLAFDQSTHKNGWSVYDNDKLIKYGLYDAKAGTTDQRISDVKNYVINMIRFWNPDKVLFEDIQLEENGFVGANHEVAVTTYKVLAQLQGVLLNTALENKVDYATVVPGTWRKHIGVKGRGRTDQKRSAQFIVEEIFGVKVSEDEADAILIGLYGAQKKVRNTQMVSWE